MGNVKIEDAAFFPAAPKGFMEIKNPMDKNGEYSKFWIGKNGLRVMASAATYDDGNVWLHVSLSRKDRMPNYSDLVFVKQNFIGLDKKAVMVLPGQKYHVNMHKFCLHLFYSAENKLPEFSVEFLGGYGI